MAEDNRNFGNRTETPLKNPLSEYNPTLNERLGFAESKNLEEFTKIYQMLIDKGYSTLQDVAKAIRNGEVDDNTIDKLEDLSEEGYQIDTMIATAISVYKRSRA